MQDHVENINSNVDVNIENADDINKWVDEFTGVLTRIILPHCNVTKYKPVSFNDNTRRKQTQVDKPWFMNNVKRDMLNIRRLCIRLIAVNRMQITKILFLKNLL